MFARYCSVFALKSISLSVFLQSVSLSFMSDFEQVCRRLFSDSAWLGRMLLGAVLLAVPVLHFFAFGYLGRVMEGTILEEEFRLPDWSDGADLFVKGMIGFLFLFALGGGLFLLAFLVSLPFQGWAGPLAYLSYIPAVLLSPPLVAAGWYRYLRSGNVLDGFRLREVFLLLQEAGFPLILPTLSFIGFVAAALPLFPLAFFVGGIVVLFYYSLLFRRTELHEVRRVNPPFSVL